MSEQGIFPILAGPVLVAGPVFLCFELEGVPGHKGRHRSRMVFPRFGKPFVHQYPDPATAKYEAVLAAVGKRFMAGRPPTTLPVALLVHAFRAVPASWSNKDRAAALVGAIVPTARPDYDNHIKVVSDALNKIVWHDDAQVCDGRCIKRFADRAGLRVEVREFIPR